MGCGPSRPPPEDGFKLDNKRELFRPPPSPEEDSSPEMFRKAFRSSNDKAQKVKRPEDVPPQDVPPQYAPSNKAKEVATCAARLREMYSLDLEIWGDENALDGAAEREMKKRKADALFAEMKRIIGNWRASGGLGWEEEEWKCVKDICKVVDQHGTRRYR